MVSFCFRRAPRLTLEVSSLTFNPSKGSGRRSTRSPAARAPPVCRFPRFLVPPGYMLVLSLKEIKKNADNVLSTWSSDLHVPIILRASVGRYTHFIFSSFYRVSDHLKWEEDYDQRFPDCIGAVNNKYLSPSMMFSIAEQFVSLELIKHKLNLIHGKKIVYMMKR